MKLQPTEKPPSELMRGEICRIAAHDTQALHGYGLSCPRCGYIALLAQGVDDFHITETLTGNNTLVTFSEKVRCIYCRVLIQVYENRASLLDDELSLLGFRLLDSRGANNSNS